MPPRDWQNFFDPSEFAQCWCEPENARKEMDVVLAQSITRRANAILREELKKVNKTFGRQHLDGRTRFDSIEWHISDFGDFTVCLIDIRKIEE